MYLSIASSYAFPRLSLPPLLFLFLFLHTIPLIICFFVRFSTPFPASTTLPAHPFTYDSSHPPLLRMLFHTIPCLHHSPCPSFYVRFLSSSASSYAFPHHSLPLPLFRPIFLRTIPLILRFFVCPINFTSIFLILFSLIYLLKVLLFIFQ